MGNKVLDLVLNVTGIVVPFAGVTAPTGWLMCFGQLLNRADYPALFAVIGTTYNTGGETAAQFRLPDMRGRVAAGKDNMGGTSADRLVESVGGPGINGDVLGAAGGADRHTLTVAQMPYHNHPPAAGMAGYMTIVAGNPYPDQASTNGANYDWTYVSETGYTGGNGAHPNVQPTIVLNQIIKT